jgi:DNA-binding ferritin-like protein
MWNDRNNRNNPEQVIPNPDPSSLTAEKIHHDISALEATMLARMEGLNNAIEARFKAIDRATELFDANLNRIPTSVDRQVLQLRELHDAKFKAIDGLMAAASLLDNEKFSSIQQQINERDVRYSLVSSDAKSAVADALAAQQKTTADAFAAQQKSTEKQDAGTQKAIDQQSVLFTGLTNAQSLQIADLKERMTRAETATANGMTAQSTRSASVGQLISWGLLAIAALAFILPLLERFTGTVVPK